jgi:glyoxylase-like metal-dependent hydrolase (beta-lactamase superfamily II)
VKLGGTTLVAHRTPGHTRGCTTWAWQTTDAGKQVNVVMIGSPNVNPGYQLAGNASYPEIAADFSRTFAVLKSLPCDVFLGAHGAYYGMAAKHEKLKAGGGNPFIDPEGYRAYVAEREQAFLKTLAEQRAQQARGIDAALQPFVERQELAGAVTLVADKEQIRSLSAVGFADIAASSRCSGLAVLDRFAAS